MAAVIIRSDFTAQEKKICHCFYLFPFSLPWSDGIGCYDLIFLIVEFKTIFFFTLLFRPLQEAELYYVQILWILTEILIPSNHDSQESSPAPQFESINSLVL